MRHHFVLLLATLYIPDFGCSSDVTDGEITEAFMDASVPNSWEETLDDIVAVLSFTGWFEDLSVGSTSS